MTGECFAGAHEGRRLGWWSIRHTTVAAARIEAPELRVHVSDFRSLGQRVFSALGSDYIGRKGFIPPPFRATMSAPIDKRLPKLTQGLGVVVGDEGRYYPVASVGAGIRDPWGDRVLLVRPNPHDGVPNAVWEDGADPPVQMLSRWYGFAFNWPGCAVFGG